MSVHLFKRFSLLHLVEFDTDVVPALEEKLGNSGWVLHRADAVRYDYRSAGAPLHVCGNLPYGAGSHIIHRVLEYGNDILSCTFMVQREVAERICAAPHSKTMGYLSIFCQFFGKPRLLFRVPPGAFYPKPKVDSAVFQIIVEPNLEQKLKREQWEELFGLVGLAYRMRRKMLINTLRDSYGRERVEQAIGAAGLRERSRPEDLSVDDWLALHRSIRSV